MLLYQNLAILFRETTYTLQSNIKWVQLSNSSLTSRMADNGVFFNVIWGIFHFVSSFTCYYSFSNLSFKSFPRIFIWNSITGSEIKVLQEKPLILLPVVSKWFYIWILYNFHLSNPLFETIAWKCEQNMVTQFSDTVSSIR